MLIRLIGASFYAGRQDDDWAAVFISPIGAEYGCSVCLFEAVQILADGLFDAEIKGVGNKSVSDGDFVEERDVLKEI